MLQYDPLITDEYTNTESLVVFLCFEFKNFNLLTHKNLVCWHFVIFIFLLLFNFISKRQILIECEKGIQQPREPQWCNKFSCFSEKNISDLMRSFQLIHSKFYTFYLALSVQLKFLRFPLCLTNFLFFYQFLSKLTSFWMRWRHYRCRFTWMYKEWEGWEGVSNVDRNEYNSWNSPTNSFTVKMAHSVFFNL